MTSVCSGSPVPGGTKLPSGKTPAQTHGAVSKRKNRSVCVGKVNTGLLQDAGYTLIQTFSPAIVPSTLPWIVDILPWIADIVTAVLPCLPCLQLHDSPQPVAFRTYMPQKRPEKS